MERRIDSAEERAAWRLAEASLRSHTIDLDSTKANYYDGQTCGECGSDAAFEGRNLFSGVRYCAGCWSSWLDENMPPTCRECGGTCNVVEKGYCEVCWRRWRSRPREEQREAAYAQNNCKARLHYDFIEVGTSDWGTLTQFCAGDLKNGSCLGEEIRTSLENMTHCRGLAVEAVPEFLVSLPDLPRVTKVPAAMNQYSGEDELHLVPHESICQNIGLYHVLLPLDGARWDVERHEVDVMWYAKSLARLGAPQPELVAMLRAAGCFELLKKRPVRTLSWGDLCNAYGVGTVDVVQIDCEGTDCAILRGLMAHCAYNPESFPRVIQFELNYLTDAVEAEETLNQLWRWGYSVRTRGEHNVIVELSP